MWRVGGRGAIALVAFFVAVSAVAAALEPRNVNRLCAAPADAGDLRCKGDEVESKWAWDAASSSCQQFSYYGCGGNSNNFESEEDCMSVCVGITPSGCACDVAYHPVCAAIARGGQEGAAQAPAPLQPSALRTFDNRCLAGCAGAKLVHPGPCIAEALGAHHGAVGGAVHRTLKQSPGCVCTKEYRPVCAGGRDYGNACAAKCDGHQSFTSGSCGAAPVPKPNCPCPRLYRPVCASSDGGKTKRDFANECLAKCEGAKVISEGTCEEAAKGQAQEEPEPASGEVASVAPGGAADAPDTAAATPSEPPAAVPKPCACPRNYAPVCGTLGGELEQFVNACEAKCQGVTATTPGPCPPPGILPVQQAPAPGKPDPNCVCTALYAPVCGKDGRTYSNACMAGCNGVAVAGKDGPCEDPQESPSAAPAAPAASPKPCVCPKIFKQVCGKDGRPYANDCLAKCAGTTVASQGACAPVEPASAQTPSVAPASPASPAASPKPCVCPKIFRQVCGKDGKTYSNECLAKCAGTAVKSEGACASSSSTPSKPSPKPCACPFIFKQVCGKNGKTYSNDCLAKCAGTAVASEGSCPAGQQTASKPPAASPKPCVCPKNLRRVCGKDGKTYLNECLAKCAGTTVVSEGECPAQTKPVGGGGGGSNGAVCVCPMIYAPVCSTTKGTFGNACAAKCAGATVSYEGACRGAESTTTKAALGTKSQPAGAGSAGGGVAAAPAAPCKCTREYKPQCGVDGKTYANPCLAKCANATQAYPGACIDACKACSRELKPICAATKSYGPRTFANCCFVKCGGLKPADAVVAEAPCRLGACATGCLAQPRAPVCCGGKTYANACLATSCYQAKDCKPGACPKRACA